MPEKAHPFEELEQSFKKAAAALREARVPFLLGGGLACWAHGGPETYNDLDFLVKPQDAERALQVLVDTGMTPRRPPEDWLLKARDGEIVIDLIHQPIGMEITDETIESADLLNVFAIEVAVMPVEDVIATKLLALNEHYLDYEGLLPIARALREQVDWERVKARTGESPYARAFFTLLEELDVVGSGPAKERAGAQIRVVPAPGSP
jgi:Uncharacterised nucleotidyltransferase